MSNLILRSYQQKAIDDTEAYIAFGSSNIVVDAPTGSGKSLYIAGVCKLYSDKHIVILVNIEPLIDQIAEALTSLGLEYSILKAGRESEFDETKKINIVMSQTFYARVEAKKVNLKADIVIQDERHKEYNTKRTNALIKYLEPDAIIGCTATPYSADGFQLLDSETIETISMQEMTEQGYLSPLKYFVPKWAEDVDYSKVKKSGSDYSMSSFDEVVGSPAHIKNIVSSMTEMGAKNKKTLVFSSTIEMSDKITLALKEEGYAAEAYHSGNSKKENERIMHSFKNNMSYAGSDQTLDDKTLFEEKKEDYTVKCIVSISKLNIGFSVNDIDLGVIVRAIGVKSLAVQSMGRLTRLSTPLTKLLEKHKDII